VLQIHLDLCIQTIIIYIKETLFCSLAVGINVVIYSGYILKK